MKVDGEQEEDILVDMRDRWIPWEHERDWTDEDEDEGEDAEEEAVASVMYTLEVLSIDGTKGKGNAEE
jgi:hypothetical protein